MEQRIYHMFLYDDTIHGLWTSLTQMHAHKQNDSWIFELHREIARASQTTLGVLITDFFGYLQSRWKELAQYEPLSEFSAEIASLVAKCLNRQHTNQFLMVLKFEFESIRTQILNSSPMPSHYEAFATIDGDEHRRDDLFSPLLQL